MKQYVIIYRFITTMIVTAGMVTILLGSCTAEDSPYDSGSPNDFYYNNPIFPNTSYLSLTITPNRGSATPSFTWNREFVPLRVIMIFDQGIDINRESLTINNMVDAVWAWNSDMETELVRTISFEDGLNVVGGTLQSGKPTPLSNDYYYIASWTYDEMMFPNRSTHEIIYYTTEAEEE
jgi:hypothetical protein